MFNCRLTNKFEDLWSHFNYIAYVAEGHKIWHTSDGSYDLKKGDCVLVRKGASIVEQFFDTEFCFFLFFVSDEFICDVLSTRSVPVSKAKNEYGQVLPIQSSQSIEAFFASMKVFFENASEPDRSLIDLKFRELILTIAENQVNTDVHSYFHSLLAEPKGVSLIRTMEENFRFNLSLADFATLSSRSVSAFKRDFQKHYNTTPGKWLLEKRLNNAMHLLSHLGRTVGEASFESGFENVAHFSRSFRNQFGMSPSAAREPMSV